MGEYQRSYEAAKELCPILASLYDYTSVTFEGITQMPYAYYRAIEPDFRKEVELKLDLKTGRLSERFRTVQTNDIDCHVEGVTEPYRPKYTVPQIEFSHVKFEFLD